MDSQWCKQEACFARATQVCLLSITAPMSLMANEFDVRSVFNGQVSLTAVNQIKSIKLCLSWGYEGLKKNLDSLTIPPHLGFGCCPSKTMVLLLLIRCWLLLPLWDSLIVLCFVVRYFESILVLQSSRWGRESWMLCFFFFLGSHGCCVALSHDATDFSSVWHCGISWSFSLAIFILKM